MTRISSKPASLYRRLPRGPSPLAREQVERNQRARIHGAMVEAVARRGYARTTVAEVIALAGVSRRAFYELFSSREACFLSTYDVLAARARRLALEAWQGERGWSNRLHASCSALLGHAARSPAEARLLLVDALGAGAAALPHMRLAGLAHERLVLQMLRAAPEASHASPLTARALVGGMRELVCARLRAGRGHELELLAFDLVDWIEACSSAAALASAREPPAQLCADRRVAAAPSASVPAFLAGAQPRSRALAATAQLCARHGFANVSAERIARHAGISTRALQRVFASREACLLALVEELRREALATVSAAAAAGDGWPAAVRCAVRALLAHVAARRQLMRVAFVEALALGEMLLEPLAAAVEQLSAALTAGAPRPQHAPRIAREAVGGAVWALACGELARRSCPDALADHVTLLALAPYLGPRAAAEETRAARAALV